MRSIANRLRQATGSAATTMRNMIRRMVVGTSSGGIWQVLGFQGEGTPAPLFGGIGFHSRPKAGNRAEAIVLRVGAGKSHAVIVATRDEDSRIEISEDETAIFNSTGAKVHIKANGDIEVVPGSGGEIRIGSESASDPVALKSDLEALKTYNDTHTHSGVTTGGGVSGPPSTAAPSPAAAQKVKAE